MGCLAVLGWSGGLTGSCADGEGFAWLELAEWAVRRKAIWPIRLRSGLRLRLHPGLRQSNPLMRQVLHMNGHVD